MTSGFESNFLRDGEPSLELPDIGAIVALERNARGIVDFLSRHAGASFNQSLYRIHAVTEMPRWTATVLDAFPDFRERAFCFSSDWLGRHFAIDFRREEQSQYLILMFEPGTGQVLEIPATFRDFHDVELVEHQNEALAADFYRAWLKAGGARPKLTQCIGYQKPLFLGGSDNLSNLELTDMDVYWSVCGQLLSRARSLPDGTRIGKLHLGQ